MKNDCRRFSRGAPILASQPKLVERALPINYAILWMKARSLWEWVGIEEFRSWDFPLKFGDFGGVWSSDSKFYYKTLWTSESEDREIRLKSAPLREAPVPIVRLSVCVC